MINNHTQVSIQRKSLPYFPRLESQAGENIPATVNNNMKGGLQ